MDIEILINQIYNLILNNQILGIAIAVFVALFLFFIISKTFRKSGLFLLASTFLVDNTIKSLPFGIYNQYPLAYKIITGLYFIGFINFLTRVLIIIVKSSKRANENENQSGFKKFLKFTGIRPFFLMLVINLINLNNYIPKNILSLFTSLSFLYMVFRTLYSTYLYLSEKEGLPIRDDMDFEDIKAYLYEPEEKNGKNQGRIIRKKIKNIEDLEKQKPTNKNKRVPFEPISISDIKKETENMKILKNIEKDLSDNDFIKLIEGSNPNITKISLYNLKTGDEHSYTSKRANLNVLEEDEYKITLSFDDYNEYDYGRFMDLLIAYGVDKEIYKFELKIISKLNEDFRLVFFDPSQIIEMDKEGTITPSGKDISMTFPKYKINFIKGNY